MKVPQLHAQKYIAVFLFHRTLFTAGGLMHTHILYICSEMSQASAYTAASSLQTILLQALKKPRFTF